MRNAVPLGLPSVFAAATVLLLMMAASTTTIASEITCGEANVHIDLREEGRTDLICSAAAKAIRFMASIGMGRQAAIQIDVVNVIPGGHDHAFGSYDWRADMVYVRGSRACADDDIGPDPFGLECNDAIYESFVAHEIAHAVSAASFDHESPYITAQEYIAAVVQFSVMAARQREEILSRYEGNEFPSHSEINLLNYQFDPASFAVKAYRHFMKEGSGRDFVDDLLSGAINSATMDYIPW